MYLLLKKNIKQTIPILDHRTKLTLCLLMVSADNICKMFGHRSGLPQNVSDGSKPVGIPERIYPARLKSLYFGVKLSLHLHPYFVYASSEGSGESAHLRRLT